MARKTVKRWENHQITGIGSQIKLFSVYFGSQCFTMNNHSAFFRKIIPTPDIMVAGKEMYLHSHIREFGELS